MILQVAPQFFPNRNLHLYDGTQFREINIHQSNFIFFEVTRNLGTNNTPGDFLGIKLILAFDDNFLDLSDFFRSELIALASQLSDSF